MSIAALVAWILTAAGGFVLLGKWISHGGARSPGASRFPPGLIFSHFGLAAAGLVLWIIYLINDQNTLAWVAFALLVLVAVLGFTMLVRWLPSYRARATITASGAGTGGTAREAVEQPAEQHFPVAVVGAHGVLAIITVVTVLLAALGVGGS